MWKLTAISLIFWNFLWGESPWLVYYSDEVPISAFEPYNPIVLDAETHPPLKPLLQQKKEVLGYLNLTEIHETSPWYLLLKEKQLLIQKNADWAGDWLVDIRDPFWKDVVLNQMAPALLDQGFTGFFLDQVDLAIMLEAKDAHRYKGMIQAAINLVFSLRKNFPSMKIMLNRAFEILPKVGGVIDYELAEALYSDYSFKTHHYVVHSAKEYQWEVDQIKAARDQFPHLVFFSLDYWNPKDSAMIKKIYQIERKQGMRPYVATPMLDQIVPEP